MGSSAELHLGDVFKVCVQVICKPGFEVNEKNTRSILMAAIQGITIDNSDWDITMTVDYSDEDTGELAGVTHFVGPVTSEPETSRPCSLEEKSGV